MLLQLRATSHIQLSLPTTDLQPDLEILGKMTTSATRAGRIMKPDLTLEQKIEQGKKCVEMEAVMAQICRALAHRKSVVFIAPRFEISCDSDVDTVVLEMGLTTWTWGAQEKIEHWIVLKNKDRKSSRMSKSPPKGYMHGKTKTLKKQHQAANILSRRFEDAKIHDTVVLLAHGAGYPLGVLQDILDWTVPEGVLVLDTQLVFQSGWQHLPSLGHALSSVRLRHMCNQLGNVANETWCVAYLAEALLNIARVRKLYRVYTTPRHQKKGDKPGRRPAASKKTGAAAPQRRRSNAAVVGRLRPVDSGDGWKTMERT